MLENQEVKDRLVKRPVQQYLATGCGAVVKIHLDSTGQKYVVTKAATKHNHMISSDNL